jgi:hypothetical protein
MAVTSAAADLAGDAFEEYVVGNPVGRGYATRFGFGPGRLNFLRYRRSDQFPIELRGEFLKLGQRVTRPFRLHFGVALVGLRILKAMALQARHGQPDQRRALACANVADRLANQPFGLGRIGTVAVPDREIVEAGEVGGDVPARSLIIGRHGDAVAIVLNVK